MNWFLTLVFLCTLFVYNLHYFKKTKKDKSDDRIIWCRDHKQFVKTLLLLSFIFIIGGLFFHFESIFSYQEGFNVKNLIIILVIPILALGYSTPFFPGTRKSLREIGWLKAVLLSFTWSFTTVILPAMMQPDKNDFYTQHLHLPILFANRFVFIAALCFLFNINDITEDRKDGISTLAVIWGEKPSLKIGAWSFFFINIFLAWILLTGFELNHWGFYIATLFPVILLLTLFLRFKPSENIADFVLKHDGLMMFKSLLLILALLILN
jgi:4-hydroxybenzoate polyprenyltransferase